MKTEIRMCPGAGALGLRVTLPLTQSSLGNSCRDAGISDGNSALLVKVHCLEKSFLKLLQNIFYLGDEEQDKVFYSKMLAL